jgi:hypothetical protein
MRSKLRKKSWKRREDRNKGRNIRGPFEKFVDWRQYAAVMQREAVTVMPSCNGGNNAVVA